MGVILKKATDYAFAEKLITSNMSSYYETRGLTWDSEHFVENWENFDNFEIYENKIRVGILRLTYNKSNTFLRDLQIESSYQGKGIGHKCLYLVVNKANFRSSIHLKLRVFSENPALKLYESFGFVKSSESDSLTEMVFNLN